GGAAERASIRTFYPFRNLHSLFSLGDRRMIASDRNLSSRCRRSAALAVLVVVVCSGSLVAANWTIGAPDNCQSFLGNAAQISGNGSATAIDSFSIFINTTANP